MNICQPLAYLYPKGYNILHSTFDTLAMYTIEKTNEFENWLLKLRDETLKGRLLMRFARVESGNFGDHKTIEGALQELRFTFGGGIRIYFTIRNGKVVLLLNGGDKSSQSRDIAKARELLANLED